MITPEQFKKILNYVLGGFVIIFSVSAIAGLLLSIIELNFKNLMLWTFDKFVTWSFNQVMTDFVKQRLIKRFNKMNGYVELDQVVIERNDPITLVEVHVPPIPKNSSSPRFKETLV